MIRLYMSNIIVFFLILLAITQVHSSGTMTEDVISSVKKKELKTDSEKLQIQTAAGLLAKYEIEANKLIDSLEVGADSQTLSSNATALISLSETVIESARFRLPQCDEYLSKTIAIKNEIKDISHERLEKGYHLDGELPKAGEECYHTKDLFIHPATVVVLTRDDPELGTETKESIKAEITEVLAHTELVRELVIY